MLKFFHKIKLPDDKKRTPCFKTFQEIKSAALFFDIKQLDDSLEIAKQLESEGKTVTLYTVFSLDKIKKTKAYQQQIPNNCCLIAPKEFSWLGQPNENLKKQISDKNFDLLMDLSSDNILIKNLFLINPCNFRVGIYHSDDTLYDFCMLKKDTQNLTDVYQEIKKYLNHIQKAQ